LFTAASGTGIHGEGIRGPRCRVQGVVSDCRIQRQGAAAVLDQRGGTGSGSGTIRDRVGDRRIRVAANREVAHGAAAAAEDKRAAREGRAAGVADIQGTAGVRLGDGAAKFNRLGAEKRESGTGGGDAEGNVVDQF